jgi:DnaJ-class molecular chaperone
MGICPHCRGSGADNPEDVQVCERCGGHGIVTETKRLGPGFVQQFQRQCDACNGAGKRMTSTCHVCNGNRQVHNLDELTLFIERGIENGHEYVRTISPITLMLSGSVRQLTSM